MAMRWFYQMIEKKLDNYNVRKKLYILYVICVLVPLIVTDTVIVRSIARYEKATTIHEMENVANAVNYSVSSSVEVAADIAKSIYMNKYIYNFLDTEYASDLDYITMQQRFFKDTLFESGLGTNNYSLTLYSDNATIVNGGYFMQMDSARSQGWYQKLQESGRSKLLYFSYDDGNRLRGNAVRRILYIQKLDFYGSYNREMIVKIEMDYTGMVQGLKKMNYSMPVYICQGERVMFSNRNSNSQSKDYERFENDRRTGYALEQKLYGCDLIIRVLHPRSEMGKVLLRNLPLIFVLILFNIFLPWVFVQCITNSFTLRLRELENAFHRVDDEKLSKIPWVRGTDEIAELMHDYNKMAARINALIETVYKNKIREQEILVAQKNAELLALHSQINPHFLFNALESIRMHSIIKQENETAHMVERLAVMQRQYVDWGEDQVTIAREIEFVEAYLSLQKYRFGDRLSFELDIEEECSQLRIPKLTIVTFVENACVHGIEGKTTPGWIFVRAYHEGEALCVEVEDTGIGMSEAEQKKLQEKMDHANISMLQAKERVGVINACIRLKLATENKVEFHLDGEPEIGTLVQIIIPEPEK